MTNRAGKSSVAKLERLLFQQQTRKQEAVAAQFRNYKDSETRRLNEKPHARSLEHRTFFTPHLSPRSKAEQLAAKDPVRTEYAVLLPTGMVLLQAHSNANQQLKSVPDTSTAKARQRAGELEKKGWTLRGSNGDLLEFERLVNPRQQSARTTLSSAKRLVVAAGLLTAAIYAGEYIYK